MCYKCLHEKCTSSDIMLKFSAEQLQTLQNGLSIHQHGSLSLPEPPSATTLVHVARERKNPLDSDQLDCEFHVPLVLLMFGYFVLFAALSISVIVGSAGHFRSLHMLSLALCALLLLHAVISKSQPILCCTCVLVLSLVYIDISCILCVHSWCMGLSGLFVLHSKQNRRPIACISFFTCFCSGIVSVLHPAIPSHLRFGSTCLSLIVGCVSACVPQNRREICFHLRTVP